MSDPALVSSSKPRLPWRSRWFGRFCEWGGIALFLAVACGLGWLSTRAEHAKTPLQVLAWMAAIITLSLLLTVSSIIWRFGRSLLVPDAWEVMAADPRPPVLFLRSFSKDDRFAERGYQEELTELLNQIGPAIAVGRPGEKIPTRGPALMYVANEEWEAVVTDLMGRARLIVFLGAGGTAGLGIELRRVKTLAPAERVLVCLPQQGTRKAREASYLQFRQLAEERTDGGEPWQLPAEPRQARFIWFASDGAPRLLGEEPVDGWTWFRARLRGGVGGTSPLNAVALRPLFDHLGLPPPAVPVNFVEILRVAAAILLPVGLTLMFLGI